LIVRAVAIGNTQNRESVAGRSIVEHPRRSRVDVSVLSTPSKVPGRIPEIEISSF
jgi:hypothetical protein